MPLRPLVTPPPAVVPRPSLRRSGVSRSRKYPIRLNDSFACGQPNRSRHSRCHGSRTYTCRRVSVATRHGDAFEGADDVTGDIAFPFEFALGQVNTNTELSARSPGIYFLLIGKSCSGAQTSCPRMQQSILRCIKKDWWLRRGPTRQENGSHRDVHQIDGAALRARRVR